MERRERRRRRKKLFSLPVKVKMRKLCFCEDSFFCAACFAAKNVKNGNLVVRVKWFRKRAKM